LGVSALAAAEVLRVATGAVLSIYLARRLGATSFGIWTFAIAVTGYPLALVEAGLTWIGTREIAHDRRVLGPLVRTIVRLRLALAGAGLLIVAVFVLAVYRQGILSWVVLLAGTSLVTTAITLDWVFYGLERPSVAAAATVTRTAVFAGATLAIVSRPDQVWLVPPLQAAGELAAAVPLWILYRRLIRTSAPPPADTVSAWRLALQAAPLTLSQLLRAVTVWSSVTVVALWSPPAAAGQFGAGQRLSQLALGFATLYFYGYLPLASRAAREGPAAVADLVSRSLRLTARFTLPCAVAATLLAAPIVLTVFGAAYANGAGVFQILAWTVPVAIVGGHFRHTLIAARQTPLDLYAVAAGAAATLGLNLALVPVLGLRGAAIAPLVGEATLAVTAMALVARHVRWIVPVAPLLKLAATTALMGVAIVATRSYGLAAALAAGGVTYVLALLATHEVTVGDLLPVRR
jgi:O-antigen/teichoic acid export membrane protein